MATVKEKLIKQNPGMEPDTLYPETSMDQVKGYDGLTLNDIVNEINSDVGSLYDTVYLASEHIDTNTENIATMKLQTDKVPSIEASVIAQGVAIDTVETSVEEVDTKATTNNTNIQKNRSDIDSTRIVITNDIELAPYNTSRSITSDNYSLVVSTTIDSSDGGVLFSGGRALSGNPSLGIPDVYKLNTDGTITVLADSTANRAYHAAYSSSLGVVVMAGGNYSSQTADEAVDAYDSAGVKTHIGSMRDVNLDNMSAGAIGTSVFFIGGCRTGLYNTNRIGSWNTETNTYSARGYLSGYYAYMGSYCTDDEIIVAGGLSGPGTTVVASAHIEGIVATATGVTSYDDLSMPCVSPSVCGFNDGTIIVIGTITDDDTVFIDRYSPTRVKSTIPPGNIPALSAYKLEYPLPIIRTADNTILYLGYNTFQGQLNTIYQINYDGTQSILYTLTTTLSAYTVTSFNYLNGHNILPRSSTGALNYITIPTLSDDSYTQIIPPYSRYYLTSDPDTIMHTTNTEISVGVPYEDTIIIMQGVTLNASDITV